jgi:hypothetical protein
MHSRRMDFRVLFPAKIKDLRETNSEWTPPIVRGIRLHALPSLMAQENLAAESRRVALAGGESRLSGARRIPTLQLMSAILNQEVTLKMLRERRERLALELASLEQEPPGVISARELLTWRTRLAELEARIARAARG